MDHCSITEPAVLKLAGSLTAGARTGIPPGPLPTFKQKQVYCHLQQIFWDTNVGPNKKGLKASFVFAQNLTGFLSTARSSSVMLPC